MTVAEARKLVEKFFRDRLEGMGDNHRTSAAVQNDYAIVLELGYHPIDD